MTKVTALAAGLLMASTATAFAHTIDARQEEQGRMIEQGRHTGTITWREGLLLQKEQREIASLEKDLRLDGSLSKRDTRLLHERLDDSEAHILAEASDSWHRVWFMPRFGK